MKYLLPCHRTKRQIILTFRETESKVSIAERSACIQGTQVCIVLAGSSITATKQFVAPTILPYLQTVYTSFETDAAQCLESTDRRQLSEIDKALQCSDFY